MFVSDSLNGCIQIFGPFTGWFCASSIEPERRRRFPYHRLICRIETSRIAYGLIVLTFPEQKYGAIDAYMDDYVSAYAAGANSVSRESLIRAAEVLTSAYRRGNMVYACGNGGSAAISNHLVCDHLKGVQTDTSLSPRVISLSSNIEIITAIANDISYDDVFVFQLQSMAAPGDVLVTISSSGDSENVVRAAQWARDSGMEVIAMTGFLGGRTAGLATVGLHVEGDNYGVIEDVHQSLMHILAQYIRQAEMDGDMVSKRRF